MISLEFISLSVLCFTITMHHNNQGATTFGPTAIEWSLRERKKEKRWLNVQLLHMLLMIASIHAQILQHHRSNKTQALNNNWMVFSALYVIDIKFIQMGFCCRFKYIPFEQVVTVPSPTFYCMLSFRVRYPDATVTP